MHALASWGALTVAALNALSAGTGALAWHQERYSRAFWLLLRLGELAAALYAALVGVLAATGHHPREELFYLYALLPLAVAFIAEQLRLTAGDSVLAARGLADAQALKALARSEQLAIAAEIMRRELAIMALSAAVVIVLAARAAFTAQGL